MNQLQQNEQVAIMAFNPYSTRYPDRRLISRETLLLLKRLRKKGYKVEVLPDNGKKIEYLAKKGFTDFLTDPLVLQVVGIPISILTGLVSSWLYDMLRSRTNRESTQVPEQTNIVISIKEQGRTVHYDHKGREISDERFRDILSLLQAQRDGYSESLRAVPSDPELPIPMYLEHTNKIIGWANLRMGDRGLEVAPAQIIDAETWKRMQEEELRGFSISGIVTESECSICHGDFTTCNHGAREHNEQEDCVVRISGIQLCEVSVVKDPVNPETVFVMPKKKDA